MPQWVIKSISNQVICTVKSVEKHGQLMNGRWLTVDIDSAVKLALSAGCYIEFEGIRYSIRSFADVEKSARQLSHGGAFSYKGLRLDDVSWQALEDTQMCDYVYGDNHLHYSGLGTFSFFASKASDVGYRVLANLRNKYGSSWYVRIDGKSITDNSFNEYDDYTFDEAKSISISSGTSVKEALDLLWSNWGVYYKVGYRTVDIITSDREPGIELKYGKDEGLKSIRRKINPNVEICTRVRAYGSERNMPYKWYNNKYPSVFGNDMYVPQLMLPHYAYIKSQNEIEFIDADGDLYDDTPPHYPYNLWATPNDIVLPSNNGIIEKYGSRDKEIHWNSDDMGEIFPSMKGMMSNDVPSLRDIYHTNIHLDQLLSTAVNEDTTPITGTGDTSELTTGKINFVVQVPNPGFDPMAQKGQEDVVLLMQSGMCQSRGFVILKSEAVIDNEQIVAYDLTCVKTVDDEIDQVFPNGNYTINGGEEYVYTGLTFNDESSLESSWLAVYIGAAEKRLLRAAAIWLREHQTEQYVYEITPDNIYLQRQKDENENFDITEGDFITLSQDDLGHSEEVVETVVVRYGKEAIPTYEISFLRRDESESLGDRVKGLVGQTISVDSDIAKMNDAMYKKVNKSGFHTLFDPLDAQYNVLDINGDLSNLKYIRANVDFFSIKGVAALGTVSGGGGGGGGDELNALLASINDSSIGDTTPTGSEIGKCLVYNGNNQWAWATPGGGGGTDLLSVWKSLTNTSSLSSYDDNTKIANAHIPTLYMVSNGTYTQAKFPTNMSGEISDSTGTGWIEWWQDGTNGWINHAMGHLFLADGSAQIRTYGNNGVGGYTFNLPSSSGTLALTSQIPSLSGYATQSWVQDQHYLTTVTPTSASSGNVVTHGTISGNTLTLQRNSLASIMNSAQYSWWGRTMNTSGVVDGGLQSVEYIEFSKTSGQSHGGHLDFHYTGNTTADYTSRIIEDANGRLSINSAYFNSNGNVGFGTTPHGTAKVNVSGAIRFDGNFLTKSGSYPEIASVGNELVVTYQAASQGGIHINYRGSSMSNYVAPNEWIIHAGTSSSYAALTIGNLTAKGSAIVGVSTSDTSNYIQIGGARLYWDEGNNSLYVQKYNGSPCNFYSYGGISALGATSGSGGLTELTLGQLNVTGEGVLFDDGDGVSKIYSSDGHLYFECDRDFVMSSDLYLDGCNLTALQVSAGTASIQSNYVYINRLCRIYASGSTVYLQTRPNTTTTTWTTKETWS